MPQSNPERYSLKKGKDLKVGDTIKTWWSAKSGKSQDRITAIEPYNGRLAYLWPNGAKFLYFLYNRGGMTIGNDEEVEIVKDGAI